MTTPPPSVKDSKLAFTALFVRRPILAAVLNTLLVVAGLAALVGVEVRELPDVDRPIISVRTTYDGAAPETIDQEVTQTIEGAVARASLPPISATTSPRNRPSSASTTDPKFLSISGLPSASQPR